MKAVTLIAASLLAAAAWTAVLFALAGCVRPLPAREWPMTPPSRVPIHYLRTVDLDNDGHACQPYWLKPATYCKRLGEEFVHDGCHWGCRLLDVAEEPQ